MMLKENENNNEDVTLKTMLNFFDLLLTPIDSMYYNRFKISYDFIISLLRPKSKVNPNCIDLLPYDLRITLAKNLLQRLTEGKFTNNLDHFVYDSNETYISTFEKEIYNKNGIECLVTILYDDNEKVIKYEKRIENFSDIYVDNLRNYWKREYEVIINNSNNVDNSEKNALVQQFSRQLNGSWLIHNYYEQNFLKIYLEFLKENNFKLNIFKVFNDVVKNGSKTITKGKTNYNDKDTLFKILFIIFDFYTAVLDVYGNDNKKVINTLQTMLDDIFINDLETDRFGFMNTFIYAKAWTENYGTFNKVKLFWNNYYNDKMNPMLKEIFIKALIASWNKATLAKVKNSLKLLNELSNKDKRNGFYFENQKLFYKDLITHASELKKSVKDILFSKIMTEEGGILF